MKSKLSYHLNLYNFFFFAMNKTSTRYPFEYDEQNNLSLKTNNHKKKK